MIKRGIFFWGLVAAMIGVFSMPSLGHDFELQPVIGIPTGPFSRHATALTMGFDMTYRWRMTDLSLALGGGFWAYGKQTLPANAFDVNAKDNLEFRFDNNIIHAELSARYQWPMLAWDPYVKGCFGVMVVYTEVSSRDGSSVDELKIMGSKLVQSSTVPYGEIGVGVLMPLYHRSYSRMGTTQFSADLDMGISYFQSSVAEYYSVSSVVINGDTLSVSKFSSPIQMIVFRCGVELMF